jgi:hypothetical protein
MLRKAWAKRSSYCNPLQVEASTILVTLDSLLFYVIFIGLEGKQIMLPIQWQSLRSLPFLLLSCNNSSLSHVSWDDAWRNVV